MFLEDVEDRKDLEGRALDHWIHGFSHLPIFNTNLNINLCVDGVVVNFVQNMNNLQTVLGVYYNVSDVPSSLQDGGDVCCWKICASEPSTGGVNTEYNVLFTKQCLWNRKVQTQIATAINNLRYFKTLNLHLDIISFTNGNGNTSFMEVL